MDRRLRVFLPVLPLLLLSACGGGKGSSAPPPANFQVTAQDQAVTATWTDDPTIDYWLFIGPIGTTPNNFANTAGAYAIPHVTSPYSVSTLVFNNLSQALVNGQDYDVSINARSNGGPGGAPSVISAQRPRAAGGTFTPDITLVNSRDNLTDDLTGASFGVPYFLNGSVIQATGAPAEFVFSGRAGATFYSTLNSDGIHYTFHPVNNGLPATVNINGLANDGSYGFLQVGAGGTASYSLDGQTWTPQTTNTAVNLNGVTSFGGSWGVTGDGCHLYGVGGTPTGNTQGTSWGDYSANLIAAFPSLCSSSTPANLLSSVAGSNFVTVVGTQGMLAYSASYTATAPGWTAAVVNLPTGVAASNVTLRSVVYGTYLPTGAVTSSPLWVAVGDYTDGNGNTHPLILYSYTLSNWAAATLPANVTGHLYGATVGRDPATGLAVKLLAVGDNGTVLISPLVTTVVASNLPTLTAPTTTVTSTPAQVWTASVSNTNSTLYAISNGHFGFEVAGAAGVNLYSY